MESSEYSKSLIEIADRINHENGQPASKGIEDAATLVLTHIISSVQAKSNHLPVEGYMKESDAVIGATFICVICSQLILDLGDEGIELPINKVTANAGFAAFQFFDDQKAATIIQNGMMQYKALVKLGNSEQNIRDYIESVSKAVYTYVISKDERLIEAFLSLYMSLCSALER